MLPAPREIDYEAAFEGYLERFDVRFGQRPEGAFVKFGRHMVQKLGAKQFDGRIDGYVKLHAACKHMIEAGSTISDALVLDFVEAAAWVMIEAPDMYTMFRGELGNPKLAAPDRLRITDSEQGEVTDPDIDARSGEGAERITLIDAPSPLAQLIEP